MRYLALFSALIISLFTDLAAVVYLDPPADFKPKIEVVGCFMEYQNKILILHRQDNKSEGNTWGIPGGKLEKLEPPILAAIRETEEETGFELQPEAVSYLGRVYIK